MSMYLLNEESFLDGGDGLTDADIDNVKVNANNGEVEAQYHLALMFDAGRGVAKNPREAQKWYKTAAEKGHLNAQYFLARMYEATTSGIKQDLAKAIELYKDAAEKGHAPSKEKVEFLEGEREGQ